MKFYLILVCLLSLNLLPAQDLEEYEIYEEVSNNNIFEGGLQLFLPQGDFGRKSGEASLGGEITYFRNIPVRGLFLGASYSSQTLDSYTLDDVEPELDMQTKVVNNNHVLLARFYPQLYLSIFEFFAEGGIGINTIKAFSRYYDQIDQSYFNQYTNNIDRKLFFRGGGGFHVPLDESWFLTAKAQTIYGTTVEFLARREAPGFIEFSDDAFELKEAAYRATTFSLSLSFIF